VVIGGRDRKEGGSCRGDYRWISRLTLLKYFEDVRAGSEVGSHRGYVGGKLGIPQNK
jgi:hypothetical protein